MKLRHQLVFVNCRVKATPSVLYLSLTVCSIRLRQRFNFIIHWLSVGSDLYKSAIRKVLMECCDGSY